MGVRNYLIDGGSGTGKTAVCDELLRRGFQAVHGDRDLRGDRTSNRDLPPVWDLTKLKALIASRESALTFLCGGCSNSSEFLHLLDGVFVLEVEDIGTIMRRIDDRLILDPSDWGGRPEEREIIKRLHRTKEALAPGFVIDASAPLDQVVDDILLRIRAAAKP